MIPRTWWRLDLHHFVFSAVLVVHLFFVGYFVLMMAIFRLIHNNSLSRAKSSQFEYIHMRIDNKMARLSVFFWHIFFAINYLRLYFAHVTTPQQYVLTTGQFKTTLQAACQSMRLPSNDRIPVTEQEHCILNVQNVGHRKFSTMKFGQLRVDSRCHIVCCPKWYFGCNFR